MLLDIQTQFSNAQAITATAASTNYIDLASIRNVGAGQDLYLLIVVTTAFTDSGSDSTVTPSLQSDDNTGFASAATMRTFDVLAALAAAGTKRLYKLEPYNDLGNYERYIQLMYTVANGNLSTGAISAGLVSDVQTWKAYAVGFVVS